MRKIEVGETVQISPKNLRLDLTYLAGQSVTVTHRIFIGSKILENGKEVDQAFIRTKKEGGGFLDQECDSEFHRTSDWIDNSFIYGVEDENKHLDWISEKEII